MTKSTITREPITHDIKIYPEFFSAVCTGVKRAELRKNDRDYRVGDTLHLMETPRGSCHQTGEFINVTITHIADIGEWMPGYVLLSVELQERRKVDSEPVENHIGCKNALDAIVSFIKSKSNPTVKCYEELSEQLFKDNCHGIHSHVIEYILKLGEELEDLRAEQAEMQPAPVVPTFEEWCKRTEQKPQGWVRDAMKEAYDGAAVAMLQAGNSPVIPDGWTCNDKANAALMMLDRIETADPVDDDRIDGIKRIVRELVAAKQPQNAPQNIPEIIPGWIPVSERMPDDDDFVYIWPRPDFGVELHVGQYCECSPKGDGWYAQVYEQNYGIEWHPITVTHWMPLPNPPKEEK
ncbi:TPA: DUF3850 domain-containing protein [Klebsiella pneumoniae]